MCVSVRVQVGILVSVRVKGWYWLSMLVFTGALGLV